MRRKKSDVIVDGNTISGSADEIINHLEKGIDKMRGKSPLADVTFSDEPATVSGVRIKKVKLDKHRTLEVTYNEVKTDGSFDVIARTCQQIVHEDLFNAFKNLIPHMIILCDLRDVMTEGRSNKLLSPESYQLDNFENFTIGSFSIGGVDDHEGVTISGSKFKDEKFINFNTPFTKWTDDYAFVNELAATVENIIEEVKLYLNGKHAYKQLSLGFDEEEKNEEF